MKTRILIFTLILCTGIGATYQIFSEKQPLPVYHPKDINPKLVAPHLKRKKSYPLPTFSLINQLGDTVTEQTHAGTIRVVDFFFTTCRSICPKMTSELQTVHKEFQSGEIVILSHTVMPEVDTPEVLHTYAENYQANPRIWQFLTGKKETIYTLARERYFAVIDQPSPEGPDFIHTENIILIDQQEHIRGFYDGTSSADTEKLIDDIHWLIKSENHDIQ